MISYVTFELYVTIEKAFTEEFWIRKLIENVFGGRLVDHSPNGPDVSRTTVDCPLFRKHLPHLLRHVVERPDIGGVGHSCLLLHIMISVDVEVSNLDCRELAIDVLFFEQDVVRVDVSMDDSLGVKLVAPEQTPWATCLMKSL